VNASVFLKGDVIASPIGSRTLLFPFPEFHFPIGTAAALARLSIYATARLKVQKLLCSLGRAQECRTIAWKKMCFDNSFSPIEILTLLLQQDKQSFLSSPSKIASLRSPLYNKL